jgi:hypothetical protein
MNHTTALVSLSLLALAACNAAERGAEGALVFTPDRCDLVGTGCDLDDGLAVGGTVSMHLRAVDATSTVGFDLVSSDSAVFEVTSVSDQGGRPTWELVGTGAGVAQLIALDSSRTEVDFIEVAVQELDGLGLVNLLGNAVGPGQDSEFDEVWTINAGVETWFYVEPRVGPSRILGIMSFDVAVDDLLLASMAASSNIDRGLFKFNAAAGEYPLSVAADNGTVLAVLIRAQ